MGVNGLWTVIQPCARPTNLATLNRKRLAVDASIWIYQFLKAVRDKEGNALRNSHVVGFFRRICKLLWFGILPVFVFDGGAPALKRATIQGRQRRREGRRDDAVRTAGKLLAVQMKRIADEEEERRRREREERNAPTAPPTQEEVLPDVDKLVYVDEVGMSQAEKLQSRRFFKKDAYHLPELQGGIAAMGNSEDPRIMSLDELEDYARQFHSGEDVNLYDFSKIDFDGDFFKTLPPADRYNILNAARLRSRLRMGLSKEQLEDMFPDRMAFSRFQIERVRERNNLTQRLMAEAGMTGTDLTLTGAARIAGEKDREYILVKNEGAEGGWALGVVSKEKDVGEEHKPIDVDAIEVQYQSKDAAAEEEEDDDFEDVPIEGLNRLPRAARVPESSDASSRAVQATGQVEPDTEESLFVGEAGTALPTTQTEWVEEVANDDEADDLGRAIAMSLKNQHDTTADDEGGEEDDQPFEDVPAPQWSQKAVKTATPITGSAGSAIARVVNNRASAAVPKVQRDAQKDPFTGRRDQRPRHVENASDSDSEEDMQAILAKSRKQRKPPPAPVLENKKNPFDGPLPFPKLDWGQPSLFKKGSETRPTDSRQPFHDESNGDDAAVDGGGGFEVAADDDKPRPLPPWLTDDSDIRDNMKKQQEADREINAEDRLEAEEEERRYRKEMRDRVVEVDSSSDGGSDVEIIDKPPTPPVKSPEMAGDGGFIVEVDDRHEESQPKPSNPKRSQEVQEASEASTHDESRFKPQTQPTQVEEAGAAITRSPKVTQPSPSPEPAFEDVMPAPDRPIAEDSTPQAVNDNHDSPMAEEEVVNAETGLYGDEEDAEFADVEYDDVSDPGDVELMVQMSEEAEEHARFASELNNKSAEQNKEDYEKELRQLRNQQKKDRRDADEVTQVMITECQALLRLFGIPYITAPMEAEAQCAELVSLGLVDGIVTDDSDIFLFGGTRVYKNMFNSNKFVECYLGGDLEKELSLSRQQLISLAQLLGSDYTEGLPGIGPVNAVEILSEFPGQTGLEDFRLWWQDVQSQSRPREADASSTFRRKFRKSQAAKLFLPPGFPSAAVYDAYLHPEVDNDAEPFQWGVPDVEGLRQFLMATIGWSKERTDEVLVPVIKDMNRREIEGTQSNITRFFGGSVGTGAKEAFAPRQREAGSKRMAAAVDRLRTKKAQDTDDTRSSKRRKA